MRAIWTGAIGFGLVNIPIRMFSATRSHDIDLDLLDKKDHGKIRYARINEATGKEVDWPNIVKGYKYNDEYVVITDEDFEKASWEKREIIEIKEFVDERLIEATYYDTPYYLEPTKGGEKAYILLRDALKQSSRVAVGVYVLRSKENLCLLRPEGNIILLLKMRFADEIRDASELSIPKDIVVNPAELKMAISLIDQLTSKKFNPAQYKDNYHEEIMKVIIAKAKGKKAAVPKLKMIKSNPQNLMAQLKASLEAKKKAS